MSSFLLSQIDELAAGGQLPTEESTVGSTANPLSPRKSHGANNSASGATTSASAGVEVGAGCGMSSGGRSGGRNSTSMQFAASGGVRDVRGSLKRDRTASHDNLMAFELQQLHAAKAREARISGKNVRNQGGCLDPVAMGMGIGMSLAETELMIMAIRQSLAASTAMSVSTLNHLV